MQINNISYSKFFEATKAAFDKANIANVQRDSVVRRFLNNQLFPNQNVGENESRLKELFTDEKPAIKEECSAPTHAAVVLLEKYENNDSGNELIGVDTYVCVGEDAINKKLADLFSQNYPDFDGERILDSSMVIDEIERIAHDVDDEELITQEISEMSSSEVEEWLLKNVDIDELVSDSFFGDFLNLDTLKISYDHTEITY